MGVRKTETRIPANLQAADLGQAVTTSDGRCTLVSFIVSPLASLRSNSYVIFVTDTSLAGSVQTFEWSFVENGGAPSVQSTQFGECSYQPQNVGTLAVTVRLLGSGNTELSTISLNQDVVITNAELESLYSGARNDPGPGIGNIQVARELVNDYNPYYQSVTLQTPESGDGFKRFVFSLVSDGALVRTVDQRKQQLDQLASALNTNQVDFAVAAAGGAGVCNIRLVLLAMSLPSHLTWTEFPDNASRRAAAEEELRKQLAQLDENKKIDLFNIVRFPKSNITFCGRIIEGLRDRYFNGTNFNDVLTGMSGTRAHWISRHFKEGPIEHE